jgi:hypothetical protein
VTEPRPIERGIAPRPLPGGALSVGAALTALLAAGAAGAPIPASLRMTFAVLALVAWPGAMLLRQFLVDREGEWPGRVAYSFVLGLLPGGLLALASHAFRFDAGIGLWLLPLLGFVLALLAPVRPRSPHPRGYLPWVLAIAWALVVAAVLGSLGAPLVNDADSLDHVATVRRIAETREPFPTDAFFVDAGTHGADPRKGTYHVVLALLCRAARVDPVTLWRFLPLLFVPVFVLVLATLTYALSRSRMAGVVAAVLFPFVYAGGPGGTELREAVYSTRVGEMAALLAAAALVRLVERGGRRRLILFWLTALSALFVHVWYALWFALAFGVYAAATLLAAGTKERARRFALAFGGLLVLALPYLVFRAAQAYGPQNVIHTEPQGLLYLTPSLFTVDPQAIWTWHGPWLLVALCAVPWFWSRRRESTGAIYLATVTPAVLLIVLNPFLLPLVQAKLGYLTMRLIWIAPVIPACALVVTALAEVAVRARGRQRALALAGLAPCVLFLLGPLRQGATLLTERRQLRASEAARSPAPWRDVLAFVATRLPVDSVIAADPVTSYSIPAYTGRRVMAFFDQHSSPNDPRGLERILDARAVFSPWVGMARTVELLRRYRVDALVVNERFPQPPATDYWSPTKALAAPTLAKFRDRPDLFRPVFDVDGAYVFELTDAARRGPLPEGEPAPRPFLSSAPDTAARVDGPFLLRAAALSSARGAPDDTLVLTTRWSLAGAPPPAGSYAVYVRLDARDRPRAPLLAGAWDKPYRKFMERWTGWRWRLRTAHRPLEGAFGPDEWRPGEVVVDTTRIVVPANLAPGTYDVGVTLVRTPHYPNTRVADYLHDRDLFSGPVVGAVTIAPRAAR